MKTFTLKSICYHPEKIKNNKKMTFSMVQNHYSDAGMTLLYSENPSCDIVLAAYNKTIKTRLFT